jgi:hypothetical protein
MAAQFAVSDQADGLRRLMAAQAARRGARDVRAESSQRAAVVGINAQATRLLARRVGAALELQGRPVLMSDQPSTAPGTLAVAASSPDAAGGLPPWLSACGFVLVTLQADAASLTQAYGLVKQLAASHSRSAPQARRVLGVLVFDAAHGEQARQIHANLARTCDRYLNLRTEALGWLSDLHDGASAREVLAGVARHVIRALPMPDARLARHLAG